jgi:hypothetical protein
MQGAATSWTAQANTTTTYGNASGNASPPPGFPAAMYSYGAEPGWPPHCTSDGGNDYQEQGWAEHTPPSGQYACGSQAEADEMLGWG